jgi:membrane-associated phospholipid phosphatase
MQKKVARIVSKILNPFLITMIPFFVIALQKGLFRIEPLHISILFLIGVVTPIIQYKVFKKLKLINDWDISDREKRPLFITIIGLIFLLLFLISLASVSIEIKMFTFSLTVITFIFAIISTWWKISGHLTYLSFTIASLYIFIRMPILVIVLLPLFPLAVWSRITLKHHTLAQTIAGIALGGSVITLLWILTRFPLPF